MKVTHALQMQRIKWQLALNHFALALTFRDASLRWSRGDREVFSDLHAYSRACMRRNALAWRKASQSLLQ